VRARLRKLASGGLITFICDEPVAEKMDRVIIFSDGKMISRVATPEGVVIVAEKT
jgi:hypothetical protein